MRFYVSGVDGFFRTAKTISMPLVLSSLHLHAQDLIEIRSKREKREKKRRRKILLPFLVMWFRTHQICAKEVAQRSSSSRSKRRDADPRLRSEICKVLAHRWSRCSDQTSSCRYQQRSDICVATIRILKIRRIQRYGDLIFNFILLMNILFFKFQIKVVCSCQDFKLNFHFKFDMYIKLKIF